MTLSIKGKEWNLVRPSIPYRARVYKNELPTIKYSKKPKTIKEHTGRVIGICVCTLSGKILSIAKGLHIDVCAHYGIDPKDVKASGWKLDNGNIVWR